ncbi:CDP-diacylglycerol--serine O-phosphatidyltransferase [Pseudodonghicola xiamenensis]|uniref:CDP-diacylglycerol--serine O-phosphatidyltransferase n=1 Tax=Pseudodonghicola xiamenensis TaxID=337702 RepID=A0A8J3MB64_9RHOB|nr:CDP-diacylglycerol--serine O-phosphatidyltransferase [Pseudodonghicola xiamenensis]GHG83323.1 CDP-diacylglycerol--serine O-phosphatidyltransferase [Pseudodonghicola xiamenensis]
MQESSSDKFPLIQLLPNMLTIAAICAGLSAIRFGIAGDVALAVKLILAACVLDGLDGRLARILGSDSKMGAELDSLADFLNFGVAPPLVTYYWALQDMRNGAWIAVLIYAVCCVMRLARFNVSSKSEEGSSSGAYFQGVPSPAGALLMMLPLFLAFALPSMPRLPSSLISLYIALIGLLMISRMPTWSFKTAKISRENVKFFLVAFALFAAALLIYFWITLVMLCLFYAGTLLWGLLTKPSTTSHRG